MKRIAIVLNGAKPKASALFAIKSLSYDTIIAADGGADFCRTNNIDIDCIIGDFDSIKGGLSNDKSKIITYPKEKDATDGELAADLAVAQGATDVDIYGGGGKRIDHLLGNLTMLFRLTKIGINARMINNKDVIYLVNSQLDLGKIGKSTLSLVPYTDTAVVDITGVKYPLQNKLLSKDNTLGVSNYALGAVNVQVHSGYVLVIVNSLRHLF